jgi:hypothetical protein
MLKLGGVYETCHTKIVVQDKRLYNFIQIRKKIIKKKKDERLLWTFWALDV